MTSHSKRRRRARGAASVVAWRIAATLVLVVGGCGLERPPDPPPLDCATIDRAAERFPDECAEPADAGAEDTP